MSEPADPKRKPQIRWKPEYVEFLRNQYPYHTTVELSEMMAETFDVKVSPSAVGFVIWKSRIPKKPA